MKSLPYEDPRSFQRQADMHCIYCTGAYNQKNADVMLNIHRSWLFFPWHRMLIYFHERILANLIGDDTFSLSFWNWDIPEGMAMPDLYYTEPFIDTERSAVHNAPHKVAEINYNFVDNNRPAKEQISTNLNFMYHQMVSGAKKVELFMGCHYKPGNNGSCDGPGTIELAPHNALHSWVGKESNRYLENMGVFYAAARDPIFWAHHPNIDRLWEVWKDLRGNVPEIIDPDWLDSYFYFHNEYSQLVRVKIRDVLNVTKLGYSYEDVERPWLNARPKPSIDPTIARHVLNTRNNGFLTTQTSDFRPNGQLLDKNIMVKVHKPNGVRRSEKGKEEETVLKVYGIDMKEDMFVKFDVYVNAIDATTIGPEAREFAGTFVNVPRGVTLIPNKGDLKRDSKTNLKLGISELLEDLQADGDDFIWVTLVPRGGTGVNTTVDGIRIEYMV
ncbi:catechol oxidase [Ranunculus cassubicifolius]